MRQGSPQNEVALYLPNADAYAHFSAGRVHLIDAERELVGEKLMPAIFEAGYNLDFFDDEMLKMNTKPVFDHNTVVLPGIERMPLESLRLLKTYASRGGIVVATRRLPSIAAGVKVTDMERAEFAKLVQELFGGTRRNVKFIEKDEDLRTALGASAPPDVAISPNAKDFGFVHRKTADEDIYFVANISNQKRSVSIKFHSSNPRAEIWNAMDGTSKSVADRNDATLTLVFEPYQSHVVVFSNSASALPKREPSSNIASSIDLSSAWQVSFASAGQATNLEQAARPVRPTVFEKLHSWTDDDVTRFFSGVATYSKSFDLSADSLNKADSAVLDFGEGTALDVQPTRNGMQTWLDPPIREAAVIYVNGQKAGSLWCPPYKLDIRPLLRVGRNDMRILVGNTALNYMAGHKLPDYKLLNLRYGERFQAQDMDKIQPVSSGLIGAPKLVLSK
jgi:hypothetical protein